MNSADSWLPVVSILLLYYLRIREVTAKRSIIPGRIREKLTFKVFMFAGTLMTMGSLIEYFVMGRPYRWPLFALGWVLGISSFALRRKAISALGQFWSVHVEIRESHVLVMQGPYRWLRHPTYTSMILELLSIAFILNVYVTLAICSVLFTFGLYRRIRIEEEALVEKFGDAYRAYQIKTPRLIPYKLPN